VEKIDKALDKKLEELQIKHGARKTTTR